MLIPKPDNSILPVDGSYAARSTSLLAAALIAGLGLAAIFTVGKPAGYGLIVIALLVLWLRHRPLETRGFQESSEWIRSNWSRLDHDARSQVLAEMKRRFGARYRNLNEFARSLPNDVHLASPQGRRIDGSNRDPG